MKKIALSFCLVFVLISCSQKEESNLNVPDTSVVEEDKGEITIEDTTLNLKVTLTKKQRVLIYFEVQYWEQMADKSAVQKYPTADKHGKPLYRSAEEKEKILFKRARYEQEQYEAALEKHYAKYGIFSGEFSRKVYGEIWAEAWDIEHGRSNTWDETEINPFNDTSIYPSPL